MEYMGVRFIRESLSHDKQQQHKKRFYLLRLKLEKMWLSLKLCPKYLISIFYSPILTKLEKAVKSEITF